MILKAPTGSSSSSSHVTSERSAAAIRRLFEILQTKYGGLPMDQDAAAEVIVAAASSSSSSSDDDDDDDDCQGPRRRLLQTHHLQRLVTHNATAIHVPAFFPRDAARALGQQLASDVTTKGALNWKISTSRGLESSDVTTLGEHVPFNVATATNQTKEYFEGVERELQTRRYNPVTQQPQLWPLDLLRLQLDEIWPAGAGLATDKNDKDGGGSCRKFGGGLVRVMQGPTRWPKGFIHVDEMGILNPNQGLFSANIYLQLPNDDNDNDNKNEKDTTPQPILDIWPVGIRTRWDWYRNAQLLSGLSSQDPAAQAALRAHLGTPKTIAVQPGDLVLLCAQRPHCAIGFQSTHTTRISLQCFIQHNGPNERLLIDC